MTLAFMPVEIIHPVDSTSTRVCLIDAIYLLCNARFPKKTYDWEATFDRPDVHYQLEKIIKQTTYPAMTWDEACTATRGMLDFMETQEPYYHEEAFMVFRKRNLIGTGNILRLKGRPSAITARSDEQELGRTKLERWTSTRNLTSPEVFTTETESICISHRTSRP